MPRKLLNHAGNSYIALPKTVLFHRKCLVVKLPSQNDYQLLSTNARHSNYVGFDVQIAKQM